VARVPRFVRFTGGDEDAIDLIGSWRPEDSLTLGDSRSDGKMRGWKSDAVGLSTVLTVFLRSPWLYMDPLNPVRGNMPGSIILAAPTLVAQVPCRH
jgi:hypothetical protein